MKITGIVTFILGFILISANAVAQTRIINLSTNGVVARLNDGTFVSMIGGLIIQGGSGPKRFIFMAESTSGLIDPSLALLTINGDVIHSNNNWMNDPTHIEVRFDLRPPGGFLDAAFAFTLGQGVFLVAMIANQAGTADVGLLSITESPRPISSKTLSIDTKGYDYESDITFKDEAIINQAIQELLANQYKLNEIAEKIIDHKNNPLEE